MRILREARNWLHARGLSALVEDIGTKGAPPVWLEDGDGEARLGHMGAEDRVAHSPLPHQVERARCNCRRAVERVLESETHRFSGCQCSRNEDGDCGGRQHQRQPDAPGQMSVPLPIVHGYTMRSAWANVKE